MDNTSMYVFFFLVQYSHIENQQVTLLIALLRTTNLFDSRGMVALSGDCYTQPHCYSVMLTLLLFDDANVERFFLICKFLTKL